jgi:serine/threonine protein kinase
MLARTEEGEIAKVLDFGLVKPIGEDTQVTTDTAPGAAVGTLAYFSPEQWNGALAGTSVDCWALAVTMYEALLGEHPFPAATLEELRRAVLGGLHKSPTQRSWQEFFGRAFAVEPQKRPASPGALFAEFERAVRQDSAPAASA